MSDLEERFNQAVADSKNLAERPDNAVLLQLYGLYKQASAGDCTDAEPGATDFVAKAKWNAWRSTAGQSQDEARNQYIELIDSLKG